MKRRFTRFAPWVALMMLGVMSTARPANPEPREQHPRIRAAIAALREAQADTRFAAHDFCQHRVEAMRINQEAIRQLKAALACDRR